MGWNGIERRALQNRRAQVRFLSHLPLGNPEMKRLSADMLNPAFL
jgi:hypothetical protein